MPDLTNTAIANPEAFEERLKNVPHSPGVYIWKDVFGKILYVGKSKVLRDRMRSYLGSPRGLNSKTRRMVAQIADFKCSPAPSRRQPLLLERNRINHAS